MQQAPGGSRVEVSVGEPPAASARAVPALAVRKRARWRARADSDWQAALARVVPASSAWKMMSRVKRAGSGLRADSGPQAPSQNS